MCKVHNSVGCLTTVKTHLRRHGINDFNSLNEVVNFQKNFSNLRQQIISNDEQLIEKEKIILDTEIIQLENAIKAEKIHFEGVFRSEIEDLIQKLNSISTSKAVNFIQSFANYIKRWSLKRKIQSLEISLNDKVSNAIRNLVDQHQDKTN